MNVLITGASRGIGLEMVRAGIARNWQIFACCRDPLSPQKLFETARMAGGRASVHLVDVADPAQIQALAYELRNDAIDLLINNAGRFGEEQQGLGHLDVDDWLHTFKVNTIGPVKMVEAFLPHLMRGKRRLVASITSKMGSIADNQMGGYYSYRTSKTALNMATRSMSIDLAAQGVTVVCLHPGWVKTDMGGAGAQITPRESVTQMFGTLERLTLQDSGSFFDIDGQVIPW